MQKVLPDRKETDFPEPGEEPEPQRDAKDRERTLVFPSPIDGRRRVQEKTRELVEIAGVRDERELGERQPLQPDFVAVRWRGVRLSRGTREAGGAVAGVRFSVGPEGDRAEAPGTQQRILVRLDKK